jgi:hypothetical protein
VNQMSSVQLLLSRRPLWITTTTTTTVQQAREWLIVGRTVGVEAATATEEEESLFQLREIVEIKIVTLQPRQTPLIFLLSHQIECRSIKSKILKKEREKERIAFPLSFVSKKLLCCCPIAKLSCVCVMNKSEFKDQEGEMGLILIHQHLPRLSFVSKRKKTTISLSSLSSKCNS